MSHDFQAPRTGVEIALATIWEQALNVHPIGIRDHFTDDLGGDSITAVRIIEPIQKKMGVTLQMTALFDAPTIADLASYLMKNYKNYIHLLMEYSDAIASDTTSSQHENTALSDDELAGFQAAVRALFANDDLDTPVTKLPSAVFILSPPRSGSTLLRIMLAGHAQLFSPQELNLLPFTSMQQRSAKTGERLNFFMQEGLVQAFMAAKGWDKEQALALVQELDATNASISEVYTRLQEAIGSRILIDKSPLNSSYPLAVERIEALFEAPKYIHLTRHPYGMIKSYEEERSDMLFPFDSNLNTQQFAEANWFSSHQGVQDGLKSIPMRRQMHLSFEQLTKNPEATMKQVCHFLRIEFTPDMLNPYDGSSKRMTVSANDKGIMIGDRKFYQHTSIDAQVADTWKDMYEIDFLRNDTLQLAEQFGYKSISEKGKA